MIDNIQSALVGLVPVGKNLAWLISSAVVVFMAGSAFTLQISGGLGNIKQIPAIADSVSALRGDLMDHEGIVGHPGMEAIVGSLDSLISARFDRLQCVLQIQLEESRIAPLELERRCGL